MPLGVNTDERERAREAVVARMRFMTTFSHELRTPLHGLLGFLDLLASEGPVAGWDESIKGARDCAHQMRALVEDFVDMANIDAGGLEIVTAPFSIRRCIEDVRVATAPSAEAKGLLLVVDVHPDVPDRVAGDRARLHQVLTNLMGNAVDFTRRGRVRLRVRPGTGGLVLQPATTLWFDESDPIYVGVVEFEVEDDGRGIAPDRLATLFDAFGTGHLLSGRADGGTGLGLAISRRLVQAMGGDLTVTSRVGVGSTFRFHVAFSAAEPSLASLPLSSIPTPTGPLAVLLADDNAVNRLVGRQILEALGHQVDVAEDGGRALELTATRRHDVILMDMEMPGVDGLEATRRLRERGYESPILGFTAHSDLASTNRCCDAGMNAVLHKPLSLEKLEAALGHVMSGRLGWREVRERARAAGGAIDLPRGVSDGEALSASLDGATPEREGLRSEERLFSFEDLRQRVGGDEEIAKEILVATVADSAQLMSDIESALARRDHDTLRRVSHSLKGCVANVSAESLVERAREVERAASAGDEDACVASVPRLRETFDRVYEAMTRAAGTSQERRDERASSRAAACGEAKE